MKIALISTLAVTLAASAALAQPSYHRDQGRDGHGQVAANHQWARGDRVPSTYRTSDHYVDYRANHLRRPGRGHRWVRTDNGDYAEIALATGMVYAIAHQH